MNLGHGGNIAQIARLHGIFEDSIIDFSANINPLGLCPNVLEAMIQSLDNIVHYPDITYYDLKRAIANYENIKEEQIILGNGAAEVIFNVVRALQPKKALLFAPTFSEYEDALKSMECQIEHYILKEDFKLEDGFIDAIKEGIDVLFICNPNNPTGVLTPKEFILKVLKKAVQTKTKVVVDESFLDFVENKEDYCMISDVNQFKQLIVVKSLTKFFAFPGIRVGYGVLSDQHLIEQINKIAVPWAINTVANFGAQVALTQTEYISKTLTYVKEENEFLYTALEKFDSLTVYRGAVNFLFFKCKVSLDLKQELLKDGILIRSCDNYVELSAGFYRVAVRTRAENLALINALEGILI